MERDQNNIGDLAEPETNTARWLFRKATDLDSKNSVTWANWAVMERDQQNFGDLPDPQPYTARWLFRKATELDSQDAVTWNIWAVMEREHGNYGDLKQPELYTARWLFRIATELDPENSVTWASWAVMERDNRNWSEAEQMYVKAAEFATDPKDRGRIYFDLASILSITGRAPDSISYLELAIDANPNDAIAHAKLAKQYGFAHRWSESEAHFCKALERDPDDRTTLQWYQNMLHARRKRQGR
jgi:tetratricopeptide (TPR) repeat protein